MNTAEWKTHLGINGFVRYCSHCNGRCLRHQNEDYLYSSKYCPHCGRYMKNYYRPAEKNNKKG